MSSTVRQEMASMTERFQFRLEFTDEGGMQVHECALASTVFEHTVRDTCFAAFRDGVLADYSPNPDEAHRTEVHRLRRAHPDQWISCSSARIARGRLRATADRLFQRPSLDRSCRTAPRWKNIGRGEAELHTGGIFGGRGFPARKPTSVFTWSRRAQHIDSQADS